MSAVAGKRLLRVENLSVKFGEEEVIKNLSFEVKKGEFLILLGPNGCGKSTLFKAILGLVPYEGKVVWYEKPKIGYLPERLGREKFSEMPILVKEFFKFKEKSESKIVEAMKSVGLGSSILDKNPAELSSGTFQRMLIAWSLISNPNVIFFDEPATGVDVGGEETVYSLLGNLWKEKNLTIFLVTHEINVVYRYATNVLCLTKKGFCCSGKPREVLTPKALERIYGTKVKFYDHMHG